MKKIILSISILFLFFPFFVSSNEISITEEKIKNIDIYVFYSQGCSHCAKAMPFLKELEKKYPIKLKTFEVISDEYNMILFNKFLSFYNVKLSESGVPAIFIGNKYIIGFDESIGLQIENRINQCMQANCFVPFEDIIKIEKKVDLQQEENKDFKFVGYVVLGLMSFIGFCLVIYILKKV